MKSIYKFFVLLAGINILFPVVALHADQLSKKDIVSQQMNCIEQRLRNASGMQWADVCYTDRDSASVDVDRDEKIDATLQRVSQEMEETHTDMMDALQRQSMGVSAQRVPAAAVSSEEPLVPSPVSGETEPTTTPTVPEKQENEMPAVTAYRNSIKDDSTLSDQIDQQDVAKKSGLDAYQESYSERNVEARKHQFKIGPEFYYALYKEPDLMEQSGLLVGYHAEYTYAPQKGELLYFKPVGFYRIQGQFASGKFNYKSTNTGEQRGTRDNTFDIRGLFGKSNEVGGVTVAPYAGFGFRYLKDPGEGTVTTTGHWGYDRISNYFYLPLGVDLKTALDKNWTVGFNFEYDILLTGRQRSYLGYQPGYDDISNNQKHGFGVRTSVEIAREVRGLGVSFEPFMRYWGIEESEVQGDSAGREWVEPLNKTTEAGVKMNVRW